METPKMGFVVVKRYAVREAKKWRYAVRNAKIERYAVRKGGGGFHPQLVCAPYFFLMCVFQLEIIKLYKFNIVITKHFVAYEPNRLWWGVDLYIYDVLMPMDVSLTHM